jgi:hypothetical protein
LKHSLRDDIWYPKRIGKLYSSFKGVNHKEGLFTNYQNLQPIHLALQAFDDQNKEVNLERTIGGVGGGSFAGNYIQHLGQVNDMDLE